LSLLQLLLLFL